MKHLSRFALLIYIILIFIFFICQTGLQRVPEFMRQINLIPFVQLHDYLHLLSLHAINPHIVLRNTIGQIIFAMPLGLLIPASFKNITFPKGLFLILLLGIAYNILKYITHLGSFDIDDLLYELIGFTAGYFIICSRTKNAPH